MTSRYALLPAATAAIVLVFAMVFPFAGCGLPLQGLTSEPDGGAPCSAVGQCDDLNPCTTDSCVAGACAHADQPDGPAPNAAQTAFDCKVVQCAKGQPAIENDDTDIQADSEECTIDGCNGGTAFHTAVQGTNVTCHMGVNEGTCNGGKCEVHCTTDAMCDDKNPCTSDACDVVQGVCTSSPLNGVNTPGAKQVDGDCSVQVCVDGKDTKSPDDSDLPKTATDCDQELCNAGVVSNPPLDLDVSCGAAKDKFCDGAGACVACNSPTQCPGVDNDCQARSCTAHVCDITFSVAGTPRAAPFQTAGDCHLVVCDGAGSSSPPQIDDTDLPDDGNKCTKDVCTNGVIGHPFEAINTACGNNSACNAVGQCGCANDAACVVPNTCGGGGPTGTPFVCGCTLKTCANLNKTCGTVTDGCFTTQGCDNGTKEGTETDIDCGGGAAGTCGNTCAPGKQCNVDTDCGTGHCADGVCCNSSCTGTCQACSAAKKGSGVDGTCGSITLGLQDANATSTCLGNNACDGANHCKKIDGQTCSLNSECVNGSCADGVCCNTACTGTCLACSALKKGGGVDGVCGNIPVNQPDNVATATCTGASACDGAGNCKKSLGQGCGSNGVCANNNCIDGTCCGVGSCPACQSCAVGANGTCGNLPAGPDSVTPNTCTGTSSCDGSGNCKKANGQGCSATSECATGTCVDSVCCGVASCPACKSCALGGNGTCGNLPVGPDSVAPNTCTVSLTCDGAGACKKVNGQICAATAECATGTCVDGVCCGVASCPACKSCALGVTPGTCGDIPSGQTDTVTPNTCMGTSQCDGAGSCKVINGQTCVTTADCAVGTCVDSVCCGVTSCPTCQSCALGVTPGTCGNIADGMQDSVTPNTCMGMNVCIAGNCKSVNGQPCVGGGTCQSNLCVDNVCCGTVCGAASTCMTCNGATPGTCTPVTGADDPDSCPSATQTCDAAGACLLKNGQICTVLTEALCASGNCNPGMLTCQ
jgi:hypothetical protein